MGPPNAIPFVITKLTGETWDPNLVTGATISAQKPDGATVTWSGTVANVTVDGLTVLYPIASTSDIDQAGTWRFYVTLIYPGGTIPTYAKTRRVAAPFEP